MRVRSRTVASVASIAIALWGCSQPSAAPSRGREGGASGARAHGRSALDAGASIDAGAPVDAAAGAPLLSPEEVLALAPDASTSVGDPNEGHLLGGASLPDRAPGVQHNPRSPNPEARWGTVEMVQAILRAAAVVDRELPGSELVVNDIGLRGGGTITHHGSHQNGRDADILFYLLDRRGRPMPSVGVPLDPEGRGWDFKVLTDPRDDVRVRLDVRRTWRFVQALAEDPNAHLQRIFLVEHLRTILLEHAERVHAPRRAMERFGDAACQPNVPHDDHLHVRLFCTADDIRAGCLDTTPMYPWRRAELRRDGVDPVMAAIRRTPRASRGRTVSADDAREAAGPMHARVRAFLDLRETWTPNPRPGRPWCH